MSQWRRGMWAGAVVATGAIAAVTVRDGLQATGPLLSVLGFFVSLAGLLYSTARPSAPASPEEQLDRSADVLATAVREQWQAEWRLRRLQDPEPLAVRWDPAAAWLADLDDNVGWPLRDQQRPDLTGRLPEITQVFGYVPSRRLVVLGAPGSGKTVLAVRFALDLLDRRDAGDPVPVVLQASTWQPDRQDLHQWIADSLVTTYPTLASEGISGTALAKDLVATGRILPVVDGLDEMPAPLRTRAVWRLNTELDAGAPLLLTCRSAVYAEIVEAGDVLTSAAVVELQPLGFEEAARFLVRTARPVRGPGGARATAWDAVLEQVRRDPDAPASRRLRQVLGLPLMVAMARAVYGDTGADPAELLHRGDLATPAALERHLLDAFAPASFRTSTRFSEERAVHWLTFLARHLERRATRDIAWWELHTALPRLLRPVAPLLLLGLVAELVCVIVWPVGESAGPPVEGAAVVAGLCAGHLVLSRDDFGPRRRLLLSLACVMPLGLIVGGFRPLVREPYDSPPFIGLNEVLGWLAVGALYGVSVSASLTAIGVTATPTPATMPLPALGGRRHGRWVWKAVGGVVLAGFTFCLAYFPLLGETSGGTALLVSVAVGAVLGAYIVRGEGGTRIRSDDRRGRSRGPRAARRLGAALVQGLAAGLLAGIVLGLGFAVAEGGTAAGRAAVRAEFPFRAPVHHTADGERYVVADDGTRYGVRPDGVRFVERAAPLDGGVIEHPDKSAEFVVAQGGGASDPCADWGSCHPFRARLEVSMDYAASSLAVRLPDGRSAPWFGSESLFHDRELDWMTRQDADDLIGSALSFGILGGLGLGVVAGFAAGLHRWLGAPADTARAASPPASLRTDRDTGIVRCFLTTVVGFFCALFVGGPLAGSSLTIVVVFLPTGLITLALSAWGRLLTTRLWLCPPGRLPWRLMAFLTEAHERGVLRRAGAVYQFRHARLQERLASADDENEEEDEDEVRSAEPPAPRSAS